MRNCPKKDCHGILMMHTASVDYETRTKQEIGYCNSCRVKVTVAVSWEADSEPA